MVCLSQFYFPFNQCESVLTVYSIFTYVKSLIITLDDSCTFVHDFVFAPGAFLHGDYVAGDAVHGAGVAKTCESTLPPT